MGGVSSASSGGAFSRSGSRGSEDGGKLNRPQPSSTALVQLLMPTYYDSDMMTHEQLVQASNSWALIVKDEVPRFLAQQKASSVFAAKYPTAMNQFTDVFLKRLCYLQPTTKILLVPIENKEKFVSQIVNFMLSEVEEQPTFVILAEHLAESHHSRGVRAADCK